MNEIDRGRRSRLKRRKRSSYRGVFASNGWASLDYFFSDDESRKLSEAEKIKIIARVLDEVSRLMHDNGYVKFLSTSDIARTYGGTRQYWEKLLREGKLPYQQTAAGKISTNLWVQGFLDGKKEYVEKMNKARKSIIDKHEKDGKEAGFVVCTNCGEKTLAYNYNQGFHINGACTRCKFRLDTQE